MAKDSLKAAPKKRDRKKPTTKQSAFGAEPRGGRLMVRIHPDLLELLSLRAAERGESRARFMERIIVGFLRADPRNPKMDPAGRIDPAAPPPIKADPIRYGAAWSRWEQLNEQMFSFRPPADWLDDEAGYAMWAKRAHPDRDE
ncbi:hypothetical protein ACVWZK_002939 [Bradyrhizobium sp. GM0.4]